MKTANNTEETVIITKKEYEKLLDRDFFLSSLEAAGVDNWSGYDVATDIRKEWEQEDSSENSK